MPVNTTAASPAASPGGPTPDFDVAVIGHGPVGVTAANFLGMAGVRTLVIEREKDIYSRARAVTVNDWTLRTFQDMGVAEEAKADMDEFQVCTYKTYAGKTIFRMGLHEPHLGHPANMMIYQPAMEAHLRTVGREQSSLDIRYGHSFTALSQDDAGVTLELTDEDGNPYTATARYVIGADGGSSRVRESVGIQLEGATRPRRWIVIDGEVKNWWPDCNTLVLWSDQKRPMVDLPLANGNHRWELPLAEGERDQDFDTEDKVWAQLRPLGIDESKVRLKGWAFYSHHLRHAETWRKDRVLLIGDAAHLMPPWAGQGMQSGIRDAANAAFKLAMVVRGDVDDSVLDTIETERRPHVEKLTQMSKMLGTLIETGNPAILAMRNHVMPLVTRIPDFDKRMSPGFSSFRFREGWISGASGRGNALGRMLPQPAVYNRQAVITRLDDIVGYGFTVYGLDQDPRTAMTAGQVSDWERLGARFVTVLDVHGAAPEGHVAFDHTGTLRRWMTKHHARVVVVRPDHFVAAADSTGLDVPTPLLNPVAPKETVR